MVMMPNNVFLCFRRSLHISPICLKAKAGRYKVSKFNNKPLTYDQAFKPSEIAVKKGWLSIHTGNLHGERNSAARTYEDQLIRKFMEGTFHRMLSTQLVIKRRFNIIEVIAFVDTPRLSSNKVYFLRSYTERILSAFLKCNVKLYIHHVEQRDVKYKYI